jgi:hypothetical protein
MVSTSESARSLHMKTILLAVIPGCCATRLAHDGVRTMATDIHESSDFIVDAPNDEERVTSELKGMVISRLLKSSGVANVQPGLRKERPSFEIKSCCVWGFEMLRWQLFPRDKWVVAMGFEVAYEVASGFAQQGDDTAGYQGRCNSADGH